MPTPPLRRGAATRHGSPPLRFRPIREKSASTRVAASRQREGANAPPALPLPPRSGSLELRSCSSSAAGAGRTGTRTPASGRERARAPRGGSLPCRVEPTPCLWRRASASRSAGQDSHCRARGHAARSFRDRVHRGAARRGVSIFPHGAARRVQEPRGRRLPCPLCIRAQIQFSRVGRQSSARASYRAYADVHVVAHGLADVRRRRRSWLGGIRARCAFSSRCSSVARRGSLDPRAGARSRIRLGHRVERGPP
jgi:hypothetical protein